MPLYIFGVSPFFRFWSLIVIASAATGCCSFVVLVVAVVIIILKNSNFCSDDALTWVGDRGIVIIILISISIPFVVVLVVVVAAAAVSDPARLIFLPIATEIGLDT